MPNSREEISVWWIKRDLRLRDNHALTLAIESNKALAMVYLIEPIMLADPHMDLRHWRFIYESIQDLNEQLEEFGGSITILYGDAKEVLDEINYKFKLTNLYSHQEIGLRHTYDRDLAIQTWCQQHKVNWTQVSVGAVYRPLSNRANWPRLWNNRMLAGAFSPNLKKGSYLNNIDESLGAKFTFTIPSLWKKMSADMQLGGEKRAWFTLKHFLKERGKEYFGNIGNPSVSRKTCSRLSPYLAWGNISLKQVYQYSLPFNERKGWKRSINAFQSRLHWHCHFIQKFETEASMEFRPLNKAYLPYPYCEGELKETRLAAWKSAKTGIPIIDACIKAVVTTGYLNFRMRAMLVSFLCHHLNVDWRHGVCFLAAQFLDFEPGIHYPQFQMQAGVTGINTLRIYNPVKQSIDKDPDGQFIKKWLPELNELPTPLVYQPWLMTAMEQTMYDFDCERDYCLPIVDIESAAKEARQRMWSFKERASVKHEAKRILATHTV